MKIILNNRPEEFDVNEMTIAELIEIKNFTFKMIVTRINGEVVKTTDRSKTKIKDGDDVTVLHLITGG